MSGWHDLDRSSEHADFYSEHNIQKSERSTDWEEFSSGVDTRRRKYISDIILSIMIINILIINILIR